MIAFPCCGALAQLGERFAGSEEVSGSIPLCSTNQNRLPFGWSFLFMANEPLPLFFEEVIAVALRVDPAILHQTKQAT